MFKFLNSGPARLVTVLLVAQAALLYSSIRPEAVPPGRPLAGMPLGIGSWVMQQEGVIDAETQAILKADDLLNRYYVEPATHRFANLYIAAFRSQRNGKAPHSPKNCLPGSGWTWLVNDQYPVDIGRSAPIVVNRYVVSRGNERSLVMYWYQSRDRVVADEFKAKFWVIADAIRENRTDTALIRVVVPMAGNNEQEATQTALDFIKAFYPTIREYLPS